MSFYDELLKRLVASGDLRTDVPTLVVAGGPFDRECLIKAGFTDVVISNVDVRMTGGEFAPYKWRYIDAENIDFPDDAFDQVIEHAGLHHCGSPHRALLEMYRVAKCAVLVFENRDSALLRFSEKLGLTASYELEAVASNGYQFGGYRNTAIPNFVYRWTEREVLKTIRSWDPARSEQVSFFYNLRIPLNRLAMHRSRWKRQFARLIKLPLSMFGKLFPSQTNEFAFLVLKGGDLHPWIDPATSGMTKGRTKKTLIAE